MKLYLASNEQDYARSVRDLLIEDGHEVTSRWLESENFGKGPPYDPYDRLDNAIKDIEDVRAATDGVVLLSSSDGQKSKGGKHVEMGVAIGLKRPVFAVGWREHIFYWHPCVRSFDTVEALREYLRGLTSLARDTAS